MTLQTDGQTPVGWRPAIKLCGGLINTDALIGINAWCYFQTTFIPALLHISKMLSSKVVGLNAQHVGGIEGFTKNPFGGLNLGLVDVETTPEGVSLRFSLVTHGEDDAKAEPRVVFDSGPL